MFEIRLATKQEELKELYRFRYSIYVEEMNRIQHDADHERKIIRDKLDDDGYNLVAFKAENIVGSVRVNLLRHGHIPYYSDFYRISEQPDVTSDNASIVTRLMVSQEARKTTLAARLFLACYEFGITRGIRYNFVDCNDHLVDIFKSFGYKYYIGTVVHKEYGEVHPMMLDLYDEELFYQIKSPFLKTYLAWKDSQVKHLDIELSSNLIPASSLVIDTT